MKLQDCFIGQKVGINSKYSGVITGDIKSIFETKDVETGESIWYATVGVEHLDYYPEIPLNRLLGVVSN